MKESINIPELRFPEFEGEWPEKRIGTLGTFLGGGTPDSSKTEFWEGQIPWISSSDINEESVHDITITRFVNDNAIQNSATKLVPKGSVLMVSRVGIGKFAVAKENLCTSQDFTNLVTIQNSYFLAYYFKARANRFIRLSQGTSIKGFTGSDIKNALFLIPELPEQTRIASFLTAVDQRINLLTKQKEALEQYRKGVMQQLFSQQLRFKDENGNDFPDWEEKRLGEIGKFLGGGTPDSNIKKYWDGEIPWISSSDINEDTIHRIQISRFITKDALGNSATKLIPKNSVLIVSRVGIGKFAVAKQELCTSQDFTSLVPKKDNSFFSAYYFATNKNRFLRLSQGTSIKGFTIQDIQNLEFKIPSSLAEQQKIASFLSSIDMMIEQVAQQIEQSKTWKKGLLQKIFV